MKPTMYHIPACPFSQRLEILLALKGREDAVDFSVVDITKPRDPALLEKTRGTTALPVLDLGDRPVLKESLVILAYLDELVGTPVRRSDPYEHAVEAMLIAKEGAMVAAGYTFVMSQKADARAEQREKLLSIYRDLNDFLEHHAPDGTWLFDDFGLAEAVFTPMFQRFWFLDYYEDFEVPAGPDYARFKRWHDACRAHPMAQQRSKEEIVKLYYDYALGAGNGALPEGRSVSSFTFDVPWQDRPMPPRDKTKPATDAQLGLA